ncbi:hypothetical protein Tco_1450229 [Tanacetum coccineum]
MNVSVTRSNGKRDHSAIDKSAFSVLTEKDFDAVFTLLWSLDIDTIYREGTCDLESNRKRMDGSKKDECWLTHQQHMVVIHMLNRHKILASFHKANGLRAKATGKGTSNPLMAGSLPKATKPT